jgi:hypothetical protein
MAAVEVLTREKDFEDLLGTGKTFVPPDRRYTRLADDLAFPRTNYSLEELKEYALRAQQKRRFYEDLANAAASAGVPLSSYAYSQGAHREAPSTEDLVSPWHDDAAHQEGLRREAEQRARDAAHEDRIATAGTLWERGHDTPTIRDTVMPTARPGPAEGVMRTVGAAATGRGGEVGRAAGGAVLGTAGKVVDAVMNPIAEAVHVVGGGLLEAFSPFDYDEPPRGIPRKVQQRPRKREF